MVSKGVDYIEYEKKKLKFLHQYVPESIDILRGDGSSVYDGTVPVDVCDLVREGHIIAVAEKEGRHAHFIAWFKKSKSAPPSLTKLAMASRNKTVGKKPLTRK